MENDSWMPNGSGSLVKSEMNNGPSTGIDQKRGHQMSMDAPEQKLFFNKKQAVESVNIGAASKAAILNDPLWRDPSSYHPEGQIGDGLFIPKPVLISNASDKNDPSSDTSCLNIKTKDSRDPHGNDLAVILPMHHSSEDPLCLKKTGARRVKVKEVRISENHSPELAENSFCPRKKNEPRSENGMSFGHMYGTLHGSPLTVNPSFSRTENYIFSLGHASRERDGSYILDNQYNNWVNNNMPYTGHDFDGGNHNVTAMLNWYQKENGNLMSVCPTHNYFLGNFFTAYPFFNGSNEALHPSLSDSKEVNAITSMTSYQGHPEAVVISPRINLRTENSSPPPMRNNRNREQTIIPFRGFHNNAGENDSSSGLISSCAVLPFQSSGALGDSDSVGHQSSNVISASTSKTDGAQKNKKQKATKSTSRNNFPANVRSLLSTGVLDGVPVKYVSWSRELTLRGVVTGIHFLCGCQDCKLVKAVNTYEFESHAGCKTKHPNNHIYFENGKTIHAVAQELKNTPREMLFSVMQNVTGSLINQKYFEIWKESYKPLLANFNEVI